MTTETKRSVVTPATGVIVVGFLTASVGFGQAPSDAKLAFEVASVRPVARTSGGGRGRVDAALAGRGERSDASRISFLSSTLIDLMKTAYGVEYDQISGPSWLYDERYDV